jgi:(p)ppGpp synthase/HD superfamily hydrolase
MEINRMQRKGEMLNRMLVLVTNKFDGVFDKGGQPYVLHCLKVMYLTKTDDEELQCIALGHDLIEDTNVTAAQLLAMGFTDRIVLGIVAMSKVKENFSQEVYMMQLKGNKDATRVKLADLRHNSDIRRLKDIGEKEMKRLAKYHSMYLELKKLV